MLRSPSPTRVGYPILLKAAAGGGGRGMVRVDSPGELAAMFGTASGEAAAAFGDGRMYVERYVENARHVEVQLLGDHHGGIVHLGDRDCSTQRRFQKLGRGGARHGAVRRSPPTPRRRRRRARTPSRLPRGGDRRVPRRSRSQRVLVPRDQHQSAGRAPGHRDGDRRRHRARAAPYCRRRTAEFQPGRTWRSAVMPSNAASTPNRSPTAFSRHRARSPGGIHRQATMSASTATPSSATRSRRTTTR